MERKEIEEQAFWCTYWERFGTELVPREMSATGPVRTKGDRREDE